VWSDDEVELLLKVTHEYKVSRVIENIDWEICSCKRVIKFEVRPNKSGTNIRLIAAMFMLICGRVHWTLTLTSSFRKPSFLTVHKNRIHLRFQKSTVWRAFPKTSVLICGRKRRLRVDGRCKRAVFENIRIRVVGT